MKSDRAQNILKVRIAREKKEAHAVFIRESNAEERAKRSPLDQLRILDLRLGQGQGAKKERTKLLKLLDQK